MRIKLLTMAALAASALATQAQNVYSLNIVGYVNINVPFGNSLYANPLDNGAGNSAGAVLNLAPLNDGGTIAAGTLSGFSLLTWTGAAFKSVFYECDYTSNNLGPNAAHPAGPTNGWATDAFGTTAAAPPSLPPGTGFFIQNQGPAGVNTFVGSVIPAPGTTNDLSVPFGNTLVGSPLPVAGALDTAFQFPLAPLNDGGTIAAGKLSGFSILTWTGAAYKSVFYECDYTSNNLGPNAAHPAGPTNGWATDAFGTTAAAAPTIGVGQGFFIQNQGPVGTWAQTL
jgi:hypothetical protein